MKRIISVFFCVIILLTCCGCKNVFNKLGEKIEEIIKNGLRDGAGIFVSDKLDKDDVNKIEPAAVAPDGITTMYYEALNKTQRQYYRYFLSAAYSMTEDWFSAAKQAIIIKATFRWLINQCCAIIRRSSGCR